MLSQKEIWQIAMEQSAEDLGCNAEDFLLQKNVIVPFKLGENARKYLKLPITCNFVSYGNNLVVGVTNEVSEIVKEYVNKFDFYHCFETPNMNWLNERINSIGHKVCFMAEYFLPDLQKIQNQICSCKYELKILNQDDFKNLYLPEWSNALCEKRKELDILGVGAFDKEKLVGLAACSADGEKMWQIGIDVLPEYRNQGIASTITRKLAKEILNRGKVPFYCSAWSNIRSVRNAIKSGFIPAWVEMTVKPTSIVDDMNK